MPSIRDKSTVLAIAREFTGECKRNKTKGMVAAGYTKSYANGGRGQRKVYTNERVIEAIAAIDEEKQVQVEYDYAQALLEINDLIATLKDQVGSGNIQAKTLLLAAIREKNSITGLHKQTVKHEQLEPELEPGEREALSELAQSYKLRLTKPHKVIKDKEIGHV